MVFFFNDTATTEIYTVCNTLSLHDALPIFMHGVPEVVCAPAADAGFGIGRDVRRIEDSERRRRAATTGERGAATRGMARTAVAECNQRRAACEYVAIGGHRQLRGIAGLVVDRPPPNARTRGPHPTDQRDRNPAQPLPGRTQERPEG